MGTNNSKISIKESIYYTLTSAMVSNCASEDIPRSRILGRISSGNSESLSPLSQRKVSAASLISSAIVSLACISESAPACTEHGRLLVPTASQVYPTQPYAPMQWLCRRFLLLIANIGSSVWDLELQECFSALNERRSGKGSRNRKR